MEAIRLVTCTHCRWSKWTDTGPGGEMPPCPRCGARTVLGKRPDDVYPTAEPTPAKRRDSDPLIAIRDFLTAD